MEIGLDIQSINEFEKILKKSGSQILKNTFTENELKKTDTEFLCGVFCVKEAAIKAGLILPNEWLKIEVTHNENGKPFLRYTENNTHITDTSISISHTGDTCAAVVITNLQ